MTALVLRLHGVDVAAINDSANLLLRAALMRRRYTAVIVFGEATAWATAQVLTAGVGLSMNTV